jgi:hypothetical protein
MGNSSNTNWIEAISPLLELKLQNRQGIALSAKGHIRTPVLGWTFELNWQTRWPGRVTSTNKNIGRNILKGQRHGL